MEGLMVGGVPRDRRCVLGRRADGDSGAIVSGSRRHHNRQGWPRQGTPPPHPGQRVVRASATRTSSGGNNKGSLASQARSNVGSATVVCQKAATSALATNA